MKRTTLIACLFGLTTSGAALANDAATADAGASAAVEVRVQSEEKARLPAGTHEEKTERRQAHGDERRETEDGVAERGARLEGRLTSTAVAGVGAAEAGASPAERGVVRAQGRLDVVAEGGADRLDKGTRRLEQNAREQHQASRERLTRVGRADPRVDVRVRAGGGVRLRPGL